MEKARLSPIDFFDEVLSESDFVRSLKPEEARNLALASDYVDYPTDTLIFSEGDKADDMYFIVLGLVQVFVEKGQQEGLEIISVKPGSKSLEEKFLETVEEAREQGATTAGAEAGGGLPAFLGGSDEVN